MVDVAKLPQNAPFLIPPATPKFPRAPEGVLIQPPPVTKSPPGHRGGPVQVTSACADEITTSATPSMTTCRAFTVMSADLLSTELCCSLMIRRPSGREMVWLGCPLTVTPCPLIIRPTISEVPFAVGPELVQAAVARAIRKSAAMVFPPAVSERSATEASELLAFP